MNAHTFGTSTLRASITYAKPARFKPYVYSDFPPPGVPARTVAPDPVKDIVIRDLRHLRNDLSLDEQGFVLRSHETDVADFYDEGEVRGVYYREIERLLRLETGAERVLAFDHTIRASTRVRYPSAGIRQPDVTAHNDYTVKSGPNRVVDLFGKEAPLLLRQRFVEINVWRPTRGPLEEAPLAICDARSLHRNDLIPTDLIRPDRVGEIYSVSYNPAHRWFYVPHMLKQEVLLFKGYDSSEEGVARFTAHTSFEDPHAPPNPLPRESIEVRAFAFFPQSH